MHVEFLLEEPSCDAALQNLLPALGLKGIHAFATHVFQGKTDLLNSLPSRLKGYAAWSPDDTTIVVLVDRDDDDCRALKDQLQGAAEKAGLSTSRKTAHGSSLFVINRIAVEELEAWFFGDLDALRAAYPRVPATLSSKKGFRNPDAIKGGTWERLEQALKSAGYYKTGLPKMELAREVSQHMDPDRNTSRSFCVFRDAIRGLIGV